MENQSKIWDCRCPCGWVGSYEDSLQLDVGGACDGMAFCDECGREFDPETGKYHEPGQCCLETLAPSHSMAPVCNIPDTQTDAELLKELVP